ncbi:AraC family transcriptional regulator [Paenibacillus sp. VTT E-133280]|uniref:helix-turn-helix domain-containing protein n=1 Tax=unclassified Paenibacillus TaxID=185978 RepID=UPI000BA13665|nr:MULTISPECIES: helix-turn-helix domain-containing protein [unclassified Paenibacillus]OZQ68590.1 AraC family transcriptional regulator [Paenibacillus sp. VTT E-133280]OZQ82918.1 AraC family transcriptional regulator [Paenibacillus sp. VTT E-133291]
MLSNFPYEMMFEKHDMLERLDISIQWGHYEITVLRFHLISFPPGRVIDFHNHSEFEFHFIPRGKGEVILGDLQYPLSEGMLYLTGPGVMHRQEADPEESMEELCLHVDIKEKIREDVDPWEVAEAETCVQKLKQLPLVPAQDYHSAMKCFLEAYEACEGKLTGYYTSIKHLVISILLKAVRAYDAGGIRTEAPVRDMSTYRYQYAIQYMEANYSGAVTLENVAEKLNISSRQLQRVFKQVNAEQSFSRALEDIRLKAVCRKLEESNYPIEQIAQSEGFTNATYLHIVFRKRLGMTPATYRNTKQTN